MGRRDFTCGECGRQLCTKSSLRTHIRNSHPNLDLTEVENRSIITTGNDAITLSPSMAARSSSPSLSVASLSVPTLTSSSMLPSMVPAGGLNLANSLTGLSDTSLLKTLSLLQQQQQSTINEKSIEPEEQVRLNKNRTNKKFWPKTFKGGHSQRFQKNDEIQNKTDMDEDVDADLVIDEEMTKPETKSPEPKIETADFTTEKIEKSSNIIDNDNLTKTKMNQIQLQPSANDSNGNSKTETTSF